MEGFRKDLEMEEVSVNAAKLFFDTSREDLAANYESPWDQWAGWCSEAKTDPFHTTVNNIINLLLTFLRRK